MAKEIIIDGVDVSGCGFLHPEYGDKDCHIALAFSDQYEECTKCEQNPNCYYKQLIRKEQEFADLQDEYKILEYNLDSRTREMQEVIDDKEQELQLAKQLIDRTLQFFNLTQFDWQNDQNEITTEIEDRVNKLQAENEKLKENFKTSFNIDNQECWNAAFLNNEIERYKQALCEIQKIAKHWYENEWSCNMCRRNMDKKLKEILSIIKHADLRRVEPTEGSEPDNVRVIVDGNEVKSTACPRESKSKTAKGEE